MSKTPVSNPDQAAPETKVPAPAKKPVRAKKQAKVRQPYMATLTRDPNLAEFEPDYGNFANVGSPEFRSHITAVLTSAEAVNRIIGCGIRAIRHWRNYHSPAQTRPDWDRASAWPYRAA